MSRSRHMKRAAGGATKETVYAGAGSNVLKEAEERKRGGKVMHGEGEKGKHRADKRARGGHVSGHPKHHADGGVAHHKHMHSAHAGRKRGGGIGANLKPLSTAANIKEITPGESKEDMGKH